MPAELDAAAMLAGLIFLGILGSSAVLWILHYQRRSNSNAEREDHVNAWSIGWINFGIFLCALVTSVLVAQLFGGEVIRLMNSSEPASTAVTGNPSEPSIYTQADSPENESKAEAPELTPWMAVAAVLLLQVPLLVTFYGLRKYSPAQFAGQLNARPLSPKQVLGQALPLFLRYLPIIWIVSFAWSSLLTFLQSLGLIDAFPPQALIQLFSEGGDPIAITLLVILAVVLAPLVEEIIFRGCIYRFLKSQTTVLPAQILSGSVFALMHANLMSFLPLVIVGILLARVYERSGNILVAMCFHACFNGFSLVMLYVMSHSSIPIGQ